MHMSMACSIFLLFGMTLFAQEMTRSWEKATFAGGCFWCMQAAFDQVEGVKATRVGYMGGTEENPTYKQVSAGETGHAESIEILFDPREISYEELLAIFWRNIDPTTKDQQFCDRGHQYRSAIFYLDDSQKEVAFAAKKSIGEKVQPIYTDIVQAGEFYPAEEYHQKYYQKNPLRYKFYKYLCGREQRLKELWK